MDAATYFLIGLCLIVFGLTCWVINLGDKLYQAKGKAWDLAGEGATLKAQLDIARSALKNQGDESLARIEKLAHLEAQAGRLRETVATARKETSDARGELAELKERGSPFRVWAECLGDLANRLEDCGYSRVRAISANPADAREVLRELHKLDSERDPSGAAGYAPVLMENVHVVGYRMEISKAHPGALVIIPEDSDGE